MVLVRPEDIARVDAYAVSDCGRSVTQLMRAAGDAVAEAVMAHPSSQGGVVLLCGPGNNGGDGYAAALPLQKAGYAVTLLDVCGCRSEAAASYRAACVSAGLPVREWSRLTGEERKALFAGAAVVVDALFGTGAKPTIPPAVREVAECISAFPHLYRIAVDVPLGVDALDGRVGEVALRADETVCLSFFKRGVFSYPARACCGTLKLDTLGLPCERIAEHFAFTDVLIDADYVRTHLPPRPAQSHKGTFGRLLLCCGSDTFPGAALLSCEGALRTGAGLVTVAAPESVLRALRVACPEAIGLHRPAFPEWKEADSERAEHGCSAVLLGCGCENTPTLREQVRLFLAREGGALVLDADAINALAQEPAEGRAWLHDSRRAVVLTPHPLEAARLLGTTVEQVQSDRIGAALTCAQACGAVVVLKGAATVIATPDGRILLNSSGSSALAKGGSGDVLAGSITAWIGQGATPEVAAALAVFLHGRAGEHLALTASEYGVLPRELPLQMAREVAALCADA